MNKPVTHIWEISENRDIVFKKKKNFILANFAFSSCKEESSTMQFQFYSPQNILKQTFPNQVGITLVSVFTSKACLNWVAWV
jgi:hypothetical protein